MYLGQVSVKKGHVISRHAADPMQWLDLLSISIEQSPWLNDLHWTISSIERSPLNDLHWTISIEQSPLKNLLSIYMFISWLFYSVIGQWFRSPLHLHLLLTGGERLWCPPLLVLVVGGGAAWYDIVFLLCLQQRGRRVLVCGGNAEGDDLGLCCRGCCLWLLILDNLDNWYSVVEKIRRHSLYVRTNGKTLLYLTYVRRWSEPWLWLRSKWKR